MGTLEFQVVDVDYFLVNEKPIVRVFGKTKEGDAVCGFYEGYQPYMYTNSDPTMFLEGNTNVVKIEQTDRKKLSGETGIYKITLKNPAKTPETREYLFSKKLEVFEADILFKNRFMADFGFGGLDWIKAEYENTSTNVVSTKRVLKLKTIERIEKEEEADFKILALDIECVSQEENRMPEAKKDPVILIGLTFSHKYKGQDSIVLGLRSGKNILAFEKEEEMLQQFIDIVNEYDPDFVTAYNGNSFDFPYLLERMRELRISPMFSRCKQKPVIAKTFGNVARVTMIGRVVVDSLEIIRTDYSLTRYGLAFVAPALLGKEKGDVKPSEMLKFWKGSQDKYEKLAEYCRNDVCLALELVQKLNLLNKYKSLAKVSGVLLQDSLDSGEAGRIEHYLLRIFNKKGYVFPCKPEAIDVKERVKNSKILLKGGFVLEPKPGLHSNVVVLDFKSMYPSIIRTFNVCPTTKVRTKDFKEEDVLKTAANVCYYKHEIRKGIIPDILEHLMNSRDVAKKKLKNEKDPLKKSMYQGEQWALKILANAFYGYLGYARARIYDLDIANTITSEGRSIIGGTIEKLKGKGFEVLYGDSITKERFVTVLNPMGFVEIKNIEEFFEENKEKTIKTEDGKERIFIEGYRALTINPDTKNEEWSPITQIIRHKTNKKIFRINQKFGETRVTEDHSIIVNVDGVLEESKPTELEGKKLVRIESIPEIAKIKKIDFYEFLKKNSYKHLYKGRLRVAQFHCDDKFVWFGWTNRRSPIKIKRFIDVESAEFEALCRLIGAYVSEGSSSTLETSVRSGCSIANSDIEWLEQLQRDYHILFEGAKTCIIQSSLGIRELEYDGKSILYEDKTHKLQMMNILTANFFKSLCGQKSVGKKIPNFMFHVPPSKQKIMLDNMIKGDGSIENGSRYSKEYKLNNFRYDTKSLNLISSLSFLLVLLNKKHTIRFRENKKTYRITTSSEYNAQFKTNAEEESYDGYVYDLSVEGNHMFVDSCGQILLHNTDSVFVQMKTEDMEEIRKIGSEIANDISEGLPGVMELQFEKVFKRFLPLSKKRYVAWKFEPTKEGWEEKMEMKGVETVRRDWCPLTTKTMKKIIDIVLKESDPKKAVSFFKDIIVKLNKNEIDISDLTITKTITKKVESYDGVQPHVEVVKKMIARGENPGLGDRISYVIVKGTGLLSKRAEDPIYVTEKGMSIDSRYYIDNQLLPPLERIFVALGIEKTELIGGGKQIGLFEAMGFGKNGHIGNGVIGNKKTEEVFKATLSDVNGFVCKTCSKFYPRPSLIGTCECGGEFLFNSLKGPLEEVSVN